MVERTVTLALGPDGVAPLPADLYRLLGADIRVERGLAVESGWVALRRGEQFRLGRDVVVVNIHNCLGLGRIDPHHIRLSYQAQEPADG